MTGSDILNLLNADIHKCCRALDGNAACYQCSARLAAIDEITRLRQDAARADDGTVWLTTRIGRLLNAGDALVESLDHARDDIRAAVAAWQEARRG